MPIVKSLSEQDTSLGVWHITEDADRLIAMLQLDDRESQLLERLKGGKRYRHWLSSRVLLRQLLNTDKFIEMDSDENRKPVLKNFPHHISLSHSDEMAAAIISEQDEVGIDIQKIDSKVLRVKHKFLSDEELALIDEEHAVEQLITCWCAKEALFKYYGKGQVDFIRDLHLELPIRTSDSLSACITKEKVTYHQVRTMIIGEYVLAFVAGETIS